MLSRLLNFSLYIAISLVPIAAGGGVEMFADARVQIFALVCLAWALLESSLKPEQFARQCFDVAWVLIALFGVTSGIAIAINEYRYRAELLPRETWVAALGVGIAALGLAIRYSAIRTLGKFFSYEVKVQNEHRIVQDGLYKYLSHPSYTGFGLILLGLPLILSSWLGLMAMVWLTLVGFTIRIYWEENLLIQHFGDAYRDYQKKTKRLIPFVW
ncbi:MAG: isoprenylcysteine carboxylmethyltransferase family protein [Chloroflexi bacterium]|nr:isoprenylcysteine carboxylmethyltransferase family protein [Chloroflexota bacterium]